LQVVARIQAHPSRAHLRPALIDSLGLPTQVFEHASFPPSPWEGYRLCLTDPPDCSHLLVIQDDVLACRNFHVALEQIAAVSAMPVCLFLAPQPKRLATLSLRARGRYLDTGLRVNEFMPVVAVLWPIEKAREFLRWTEDNPRKLGHIRPRSDDSVAGRWASLTRQTIRFTVPSLVQHLASEPSVKGAATAASSFTALSFCDDGSAHEW
jgi:hypothetical protein